MSDLIEWSAEYLIGLEEFDVQHKELTILVNDVLRGCQQMLAVEEIEKRMTLMIKYTKWHFRCEDGLMRIYQYPDMAIHLEEHRTLIKNIEDKSLELTKGPIPPSQLYQFFIAWFGGHAFGSDIEMAKFINNARQRSS
jgi:hemerythrin